MSEKEGKPGMSLCLVFVGTCILHPFLVLFPRHIPLILLLFHLFPVSIIVYLCYLLRYLGLFLLLFVYKDIHYASCSHATVHTLVSICHTVSYIV